jgi:hypothetical protein
MLVELYTKPDCPLCEAGAAVVGEACRRLSIEWSETSIYSSELLFQQYRYLVPVLCVNGRAVATLQLSRAEVEGQLRGALEAAGRPASGRT